MGFVFFIFLWPLVLFGLFMQLLGVALTVAAWVCLAWNLLVLLFLLWLRRREKVRATLDRGYIDAQTGGKRTLLLVLRYGWVALTVWVAVLALACAAYLIWRPDLLELLLGP